MAPSNLRLHLYLARYLSKKHLYPRIRSPSFYLSSTSQINGHLPHQFARHVVQTPWSHFFSCFSSPTQCRYVSTTTSPIGEILETISKGARLDEERNGVVKSLDLFTSNDVAELPDFSSEVSFATARKETNLGLKDDDFAESCRVVTTRDPAELYRELRGNSVVMRREDFDGWGSFREVMDYFVRSGWASDQALAVYIPRSFFPTAASKFLSFLKAHATLDVQKCIVFLGPSRAADRFLFPLFAEFCIEEFSDEIKKYRLLVESADLTMPHTWFPFARAMKRKIIYHCGPTNSGKTYNALQRFMEAKKGVYCSPLRLLAMEVFDKVNSLGVYCSLLTGQEKKLLPFSNHTACTIEMVSTDELYDVAIIDEIQMAADLTRGHAWTRALLGLKADEIHLCGDPSVLKLVRKICKGVGDELVEHHYKRFKPLVVEAKTMLGDLRNVRPGDCIVAFSRREIFEVKLAIEKFTKHRCCVIYGALPPETRRQQANLFNEEDNEYDVLVASDAVGMGLNLNIRRIVFYTLSKYNGDKIVPVPASQVKQIAGRAGRRGCRYPDGLVTTLQSSDLDYLIECLKEPFEEIKQVGLFPFFEQVELFAGQYSDISFPQLLDKFRENCRLDGNYFLCHLHHVRKVAQMLEKVPGLSLQDRFNFCFAPVNIRDPKAMYHLLRFASRFSEKRPVSLALGLPKGSARNDSELLDLECKHQVLSMYLWLSQQFDEDKFPFKNKVEQMVTDIVSLLNESLLNACWKPESRYQSGRQKTEEEKTYQEDNLEEDIHDELSYSRNGLPRTKSIIKPSQKDKMHSFLKAST